MCVCMHKSIIDLIDCRAFYFAGIKDYRSEKVGLYATSSQRPIQYSDFLKNPSKRNRYWARNYLGWSMFSTFQPNNNHHFLSAMEKHGNLHWLVTQNVDSLHLKAGSTRITELHGSAARYFYETF